MECSDFYNLFIGFSRIFNATYLMEVAIYVHDKIYLYVSGFNFVVDGTTAYIPPLVRAQNVPLHMVAVVCS